MCKEYKREYWRKRDRDLKNRLCIRSSDLIREVIPGWWVYVLQVLGDDESPVKIGESGRLLERLREQQQSLFIEIDLVALIPGRADVEEALHGFLAEYRMTRYGKKESEMFAPSPEVFRVVSILAETYPPNRPGLTDPQTLLIPAEVLALLEQPDSSELQAAE